MKMFKRTRRDTVEMDTISQFKLRYDCTNPAQSEEERIIAASNQETRDEELVMVGIVRRVAVVIDSPDLYNNQSEPSWKSGFLIPPMVEPETTEDELDITEEVEDLEVLHSTEQYYMQE